jgi:hypothetical protein
LSIHPQFRTANRDLSAAHLVGERHLTRLMSPAKRLDNELCTRYSFLYVYISALLLLLFFVLFCFVFSPATLSTKRGYKKKRGQRPPSTLSLYNRFLFFRQTIILHTQPRSTYTHTHKSRLLLLLFMCMFVFVTVVTLQKLFHSPSPPFYIFLLSDFVSARRDAPLTFASRRAN